MMNRRQFVYAAASAAALARASRLPAFALEKYDLIIRGGRVIDPSVRLDAIRDVAISAGRIVAVEPSIAGDAADIIDARGKLVVPGLIDIHTHAGRSKEGPPLALQDGVTGWVDAGTAGADTIDQVAADSYGTTLIGQKRENVPYLKMGHERGLGTMFWENLRVKEV